MLVCGTSEPGMAPRESRNSRISATRIEVSCRQNHRAQPIGPRDGKETSSSGAVDSCEPAAPTSASSASRAASVLVVIDQIPGVKLLVQLRMVDIRSAHAPVRSRTPSTTIMPPPSRITHT